MNQHRHFTPEVPDHQPMVAPRGDDTNGQLITVPIAYPGCGKLLSTAACLHKQAGPSPGKVVPQANPTPSVVGITKSRCQTERRKLKHPRLRAFL